MGIPKEPFLFYEAMAQVVSDIRWQVFESYDPDGVFHNEILGVDRSVLTWTEVVDDAGFIA